MFYSNWWLYQEVYLAVVRRAQLNTYLTQLHAGEKPLFIHINRTAGSSIAAGLGVTEIHKTLEEYNALYLKKYKVQLPLEIPVITCVRNPFDRVASEYFYRIKTNQNMLATKPIAFEDWVVEAYWLKNKAYRDREIMFGPMQDWILTNRLHDLFIMRFESLEEDYKTLVNIYNAAALPWKKQTQRPCYKEVFTDVSREVVETVFKEDLNRFNYSY